MGSFGICVWLLFVENLLVGDIAGVGNVGRLLPEAAGKAISGQDPNTLLAPAVGLVVLALYAAVAAVTGWLATSRPTSPKRREASFGARNPFAHIVTITTNGPQGSSFKQ